MDRADEDVKITLAADSEMDGIRLDKTLTLALCEHSRSFIQKLIAEGRAEVNGKKAKASLIIHENDMITLMMPPAKELKVEAEDIPLSVLYEDGDVIVIDKPKGMVVHPAPGHLSGTVVNAVLYHCSGSLSGIGGVLRPGIVHRIDKDTTGAIVICKNDKAHTGIAEQLACHSIERTYLAIARGRIEEEGGTVDAPIGRDTKDRKKMAVAAPGSGKRAVTHYRVLERFAKHTYIECRLETGRTHQIRVHLSSIGHPILGDTVYGSKHDTFQAEGQCLHAHTLGFVHPVTGEMVRVSAPVPQYFNDILEKLRRMG